MSFDIKLTMTKSIILIAKYLNMEISRLSTYHQSAIQQEELKPRKLQTLFTLLIFWMMWGWLKSSSWPSSTSTSSAISTQQFITYFNWYWYLFNYMSTEICLNINEMMAMQLKLWIKLYFFYRIIATRI